MVAHKRPTPLSAMIGALSFAILLFCLFDARPVKAIWPHPTWLSEGAISRSLDPSKLKLTSNVALPPDVQEAFARTMDNIARHSLPSHLHRPSSTGKGEQVLEVHLQVAPWGHKQEQGIGKRGAKQSYLGKGNRTGLSNIAAESIQKLEELDEKYHLMVPQEGRITIGAASALGVFRGLTTLEHLVYAWDGHALAIPNTPVKIKDEPAYPYRGLLIDTARNYYPIAALKHQLDAMAFVKMNQFHWHIVDSQSFPLELPDDLAKLSKAGAYSAHEVYSAADVADLVQYAAERGINVNVEIDMPGHTYAGVNEFDSSLLSCPDISPWSVYANEPPSGQLDLSNYKVHDYVGKLLTAISKMFPSPYVSTGNDEVNLACYNVANNSDIDESLLKPFVSKAHAVLKRHGKTAMVWEEAALNFPETGKALLPGTIVEAWTTPDNVAAILTANEGVKLLHAPYTHFYLDCGRGSWLTNTTAAAWCEYVPWGKMYTFDPTEGTSETTVHRVIGGEAALWSEQSDAANADGLIWPRSAAAAEVFWTGQSKSAWKRASADIEVSDVVRDKDQAKEGDRSVRNLVEATPRLAELRDRLVARGVRAEPLQPRWCVSHPESCMSPA
ncbi:hypothetical protein BCV69DRAFT_167423 [Microstroma glucosiphilum]|uniref:Beta-hexosaminidase n=1 Tax=Pseudomicrostroma glucosiphilum TaxID=1684307 RepID=A0A316U928_9BASI|nr:hypothetical protein BCV69DRAFT_167423 [Pseudomicrostroma glucosiphilum]PWN21338.1 hypothetical protein BCV69DRAFT_167423 [Pseudomicrostroma glucosiphilum]